MYNGNRLFQLIQQAVCEPGDFPTKGILGDIAAVMTGHLDLFGSEQAVFWNTQGFGDCRYDQSGRERDRAFDVADVFDRYSCFLCKLLLRHLLPLAISLYVTTEYCNYA